MVDSFSHCLECWFG